MPIYTLDTLRSAPKARFAVIGHPIAHSLSPKMHQTALDAEGIDARYIALEVPPGQVAQAFSEMRAHGFLGCNVTVPHKFSALQGCDEITDTARALGAVNTVRFDADAIRGTNTDGYGFEQSVLEAFNFSLLGKSIMILGAGGGAGSALAAHCARSKVRNLALVNRSFGKIETLAQKLRKLHPEVTIHTIAADDLVQLKERLQETDLLVNATSLGLKETDSLPIPASLLFSKLCVFDAIYANTPLLRAAKEAGCQTTDGSLMLLHQGVAAYRYWLPDASNPEIPMRKALGIQ